MKANYKALAAAGLCICLAFGVTACGNDALDGTKTVATVGEKTMTLAEANFILRYQQSQSESMYESMIGNDIYSKDLYGNGQTFGDTMKESVMNTMRDYYILEDKAEEYGIRLDADDQEKISAAADAFLEANEDYTKEQMTADKETVERVLTLMTLSARTADAAAAQANVTITDEEAAQRGFRYAAVSKTVQNTESGESEPLSEEALAAERAKLEQLAGNLAAGTEFASAAELAGLTEASGAYSADNTGAYPEEVIAALDALKEGEVSGIVETDSSLYLLQLTAEVDAEATEARKEALQNEKETEYYNGLMEKWREEYPLDIVEDVWKEVVFDRSYDIAQ